MQHRAPVLRHVAPCIRKNVAHDTCRDRYQMQLPHRAAMAAGLVEALVGRFWSADFQNLALLFLLLAVLMLRPYGLFGERVERAV